VVWRDCESLVQSGACVASARRRLNAHDVRCLEALGALSEIELNRLALVQAPIAVLLDSGEMHEDIFTRGPLDETITFGSVKPLDCSFLSHNPLLSTLNS